MASENARTKSLWADTAGDPTNYGALESDLDIDVVVVGAGYTGLHAALQLRESGKEVAILESEQPGWGASGRNGGQVIPGLHATSSTLSKTFGKIRGERWYDSALNSADMLFQRIRDHELDCDAEQPGYLTLAHNEKAYRQLALECEESDAYRARHYMIDRKEAARLTGSEVFAGARVSRTGGSVHPLKLSYELARRVAKLGGLIFGQSKVEDISRDDKKWKVRTPKGVVTARSLILATNAYTGDLNPQVNRRFVKVCSFQISTDILDEDANYIFPQGHAAADTLRLLHYFRRSPDGRLVMGGRAPFRTDVSIADADPLRQGIEMIYPNLKNFRVTHCWAGWVGFTMDHLPAIVSIGPNGFAVYGYNASGVALSCLTGSDVGRLACGEDPENVSTPATEGRPVPFHAFSRLGAKAAIRAYSVMDKLGI